MINILICDDDKKTVDFISSLIEDRAAKNELEISTDKCLSASDALSRSKVYDIAFVDVEMDSTNGIELSKRLHDLNGDVIIIIVTAYRHYLDDAMRIRVFRYLSKPISADRLLAAFEEAMREYRSKNRFIVVQSRDEIHRIKLSEILWLESVRHGTVIHTKRGEIKTSRAMRDVLAAVSEHEPFSQSYHGIYVNLRHVLKFDKKQVTLKKSENETATIYMSQRKYAEFKKEFFRYAGGVL